VIDLDPRRLKFLLAVARTGGVLAAADELAITPSAVSQQIARLEKETKRTLLERTPSGSVLTPAGLALAEAAEDVERALALAVTRLEEEDSDVTGVVRIGGFQSFLATILSPSLPAFRARYPALRFETVEADLEELMRRMRNGQLDAVIVDLDAEEGVYAPPRGTAEVPLLDEPWKLVVPTGSVLAAEVLDLSRLNLPWLDVEEREASAKAVRRVRRLLGAENLTSHTYWSTQNALALVTAGEGVALVPSLALEGLALDGIDALDIPGLGQRRIVLRHLLRGGRGMSTALETATTLIREAAAAFEPTT
jgi:molybdate transport repressor ModE-like protein